MTVAQFLDGLAAEAQIDVALLGHAGTSVVGREERAGTGIVVCYWAGDHALIWTDPELQERLRPLGSVDRAISLDEATAALTGHGLERLAVADMRVLTGPAMTPPSPPSGYNHRWLETDNPDHVALVRAFAERSDPEEVDEAGLEDMDNFDEAAINVLTAADDPDGRTLLAYGSGCDWDWDPLFCDIGVLVDPANRWAGLGRFVVANTTARLEAEGRLPLYRHGRDNLGSAGIAKSLGFETATSLAFFTPPAEDSSSSDERET